MDTNFFVSDFQFFVIVQLIGPRIRGSETSHFMGYKAVLSLVIVAKFHGCTFKGDRVTELERNFGKSDTNFLD